MGLSNSGLSEVGPEKPQGVFSGERILGRRLVGRCGGLVVWWA